MRESEESTPLRIRRLLVKTDQPFLTTGDIADMLDISKPTVLRHVEEASALRGIKSREVGQTTVYYRHEPELPRFTNQFELVSESRNRVLQYRAKWLDAKEEFYQRQENGDDLRLRMMLHQALQEYALHCGGIHYQPSFRETEEPEILLGENSGFTEEEIEYYDSEMFLFESEWYGDVSGISGYLDFSIFLSGELGELLTEALGVEPEEPPEKESIEEIEERLQERHELETTVRWGDLPEDELDRIYPDAADLVHAGNLIDRFMKTLHDINW